VPQPNSYIYQKDEYVSLNGSATSWIETKYDSYGNTTEVKSSNASGAWGSGATTTLVSDKLVYYGQVWNGSSCTAYSSGYIRDTPCYTQINDGSGTAVAKTQITYSNTGHPTATSRWISGTSFAKSSATYNHNGTIATATDADANETTFNYDGSCNSMVVTSTTLPTVNGVTLTTSKTWDCNGGVVASSTDANKNVTNYSYVIPGSGLGEPLYRPTVVTYPDGGSTTTTYSTGASLPWSISTSTAITASTNLTRAAVYDGLGRVSQTQLTSDPDCPTGDIIATTYDLVGQIHTVSNPYCATTDPSYGLTTYAYDALNRVTKITHPDSTSSSTSYKVGATDLVDEGNGTQNVERISQVDGLGRVTSVCEVTGSTQSGPGGKPAACGQDIKKTGFLTSYTYDAVDNLLSVSQGILGARTFAYDSMSRLLCAANPETGVGASCPSPDTGKYTAGTTRYAYDANGNMISRVRPAPNQPSTSTIDTTTYAYDALNRLTQESYSDGVTPPASFGYDQTSITMGSQQLTIANSLGRLSWTCVEYGGSCPTMTATSYDSVGRVAELWQRNPVNSNNIWVSYTYDLLGDETDRNLSGSDYGPEMYNGAGRLTSFGAMLAKGHYDAFGHLTSATLGNGLMDSWGYDNRGRPAAMAVGTTCAEGVCTGSTAYSYSIGYAPNSDILSAKDSVNGTWTYTYDDFNRVLTSNCSATCPDGSSTQGFSYAYDRYGNRWNQTVTAGSGPQPTLTFNGVGSVPTNRIDTYSYDAAGNLLNDGTNSYQYDAENRITSANNGAATYTYTAGGQRAGKTVGNDTTDIIYDREGQVILYNSSSQANAPVGQIYVAGMHLGGYVVNSTVTKADFYYDHADWLGTERAHTNMAGVVCEKAQSLPFGDGQVIIPVNGGCTDATDVSPMHFTGKERDPESGLDNFGARYNSSTLGRFMTPDWAGKPTTVPYAKFGDPQTLNLYSYVENGPLNRVDASGHNFATPMLMATEEGDEADYACGWCASHPTAASEGHSSNGTDPAQTTTTSQTQSQNQSATAQTQVTPQSLRDQIPPDIREAMATVAQSSEAPTADDTTGRNHEESGVAGQVSGGGWIVSRDKPGASGNPDVQEHLHPSLVPADQNVANLIVNPQVFFHSHPSDRTPTHYWKQPPSADADIPNAVSGRINIVFATGENKVYFYNNSGVIGKPMKMKDFLGQ